MRRRTLTLAALAAAALPGAAAWSADAFPNKPLKLMPLPPDDPRQVQPDITRARNTLGWEPSTPLVEGLKPTVSYFRSLLS